MNKNNNLYCVVLILLLTTALLLKTCSKEVVIESPLTSYTDSLEIENKTLITLAEKNNNEIKKLEIDKLVIQEQLGILNNNILLIKAEYKKESYRVRFLNSIESVDYLSKRISVDSVLMIYPDSTVKIDMDQVKLINGTFSSNDYLKVLNDSLETEIWVCNSQHIVDDQINKLQDTNIKDLYVIIDNKDKANKKVTDGLKDSEDKLSKEQRKSHRKNVIIAITATTTAVLSLVLYTVLF